MDFTNCNYNYSLYKSNTHKQEFCLELLNWAELFENSLSWTAPNCRKLKLELS
jgi:hypothetical protein